jgi:DNA-binding transcriptional regulator YhcF (GntR family)
MEKIKLDKNPSALPVYQQIYTFFENQIKTGRIAPGEKIPTERELALSLNTARGTVKKAYEELVRQGLVDATPGRGSFVTKPREIPVENRKNKAIRLIDELIDELARLKFSTHETRVFFDLRLLGREEELQNLSVAAIDCNPEALAIFERQFLLIPNVNMATILLDDLVKDPAAEERLRSFDLLLSTTTHHQEFLDRFPALRARTVQVAVAPTRDSIVNLARLTPSQKIGVVCQSQRFLDIILDHLRAFDIPSSAVVSLFWSDIGRLDEFIRTLDAVVVPAGYSIQRNRDHLAALQAFTERGGLIVSFDYQIERGSLLHVEERLRSLLEESPRSV